MKKSTYDKFPRVAVPGREHACVTGWDAIGARLERALAEKSHAHCVLVVECYPGIDEAAVLSELTRTLSPALALAAADCLLAPDRIDDLVAPFLGGDDPVFGRRNDLILPQFFDPEKLPHARKRVESTGPGLVLIVGCGATLISPGDLLVYADLARWEAQLRFRRKTSANLGAGPGSSPAHLAYKRAFFIDWRVADAWKRPLIAQWNFVLDTHDPHAPKLAEGDAVRDGLRHAVTRPFRVVPFFDPAPWGGQWMKHAFALDPAAPNYGWCFDCVPEENSLLLDFGGTLLELPSIDLVFDQPRALLGEAVYARFGAEFPIRFDFLDTIGGGNLSFQVHPLTAYIQRHFGMNYTQDESYYLLEAGPDAMVYLGLREGIDPAAMEADLRRAQAGKIAFPADDFAVRWPAHKHDHFLIPAGTPHCSGRDSVVLEISATPYIFTFKMWDWARLGLDGKPRPIHLDHALANIQWDRTQPWVERNLVNRFEPVAQGEGWREERTGLHETEFIETRRHWFTAPVPHHTHGTLNVLNLVQGDEVIVESPHGSFAPFLVHYAETFIIPAAVGPYLIRPTTTTPPSEYATLKAFVRP